MARILVIRISAIGDVAMTIPVIYAVAQANPMDKFTVLTQSFLMPIFMNRPFNVELKGFDTKGSERNLIGLLRFSAKLAKEKYDLVLDLHDVLRSKVIRSYFNAKGTKVIVYDKGRNERALLTARRNKQLKPLRPVIERYADVFRCAGFSFHETFTSLYQNNKVDTKIIEAAIEPKKGKWIGIAPFAKHRGKVYPLALMEEVIANLSSRKDITVFLFGGRGEDEITINNIALDYPNIKSAAAKYSLDFELLLISQLDLLVSMDSANMHFASLVNTPVVSVWGATHPFAGFYGYKQRPEDCVQIDLSCRPCSVFGNKPCFRKDWACMTQIAPEMILAKIDEVLKR